MANIRGITIEINGNTSPLQKALSDVNKSIKDTQKQLREVDKLLKLDPKNTELLRQKQKLLSKSVDDVKSKLDKEREALKQLEQQDRTPEVTEKMDQLKRAIIEDEQQLESAKKSLKEFGSVGTQQAKVVGEQMQKAGKAMQDVGSNLTTHVTAPIVAAGTAAVTAASSFEDAIAKLSTIADTSEETGVPMQELQSSIMDLSDQTGIAAAEIADNVYNAISAGQKTGDAVNFVSNATKLAKAGFTSSAAALDILTTTLNAYGLEASDVTKVSDILINTQNLGKTTVDELASSMGKVIPTAKSQNVSLEELASAYAVMTSNGIATAETTTYLNSMLNELGKDGTAAADALRAGTEDIKEGGLSMAEAMEQGWTLADVLGVLQKQADESGTSIANMFGSAEAGKAANVLAGNTEKYNDALVQMQNAAGATDEAFAKLDTSSAQARKALNSIRNISIEVGTTILEELAPALESAREVIQSLKEKWEGLSPEQQKMIVQIAGIAAVIGPIVALIGGLISGIGTLITSLTTIAGVFGTTIAVVGGVAAGITALIAVIALLVLNWDKVKEKAKEVWESVSEYVGNLKDDVRGKFEEIKSSASSKVEELKTNMANKWSAIRSDVAAKANSIKSDVTGKFNELRSSAVSKFEALRSGAVAKFDSIKDKARSIIDTIKGFFDNLKLKIPQPEMPKLPHFSLETSTRTIAGREITFPSGINVEWYGKAMDEPWLFTNPTVIQTPYGMIGAGEAGDEVMYGRRNLLRDIAEAAGINNAALIDGVYEAMTKALDNADLKVIIGRREFGRIVREVM